MGIDQLAVIWPVKSRLLQWQSPELGKELSFLPTDDENTNLV